MKQGQKDKLINLIIEHEKLRPLSRVKRFLIDPIHTPIYYLLASLSHIKPYKITWKTLWNTKMTGYLPESNTFYYYGFCEANLTSFLLRFLKNGDTFLDVGAHIGFYSALTSELVGKNGKVFSFEPTPWTYELLKTNTSKLENVKIINAGASDTEEEISFADYGPGYGAYNSGSSEGTVLKFKPTQVKVKTVTLDDFCEKNNVSPTFIKLDAEGFEYKILDGMKKILAKDRPLITLEMANGELWADNCKKSSTILFANEYLSYEMTTDGYIKSCNIESSYIYTNILFVPKEKEYLIAHLIQS